MRTTSQPSWWLRRRVWGPLGVLLLVSLAAGLALVRSNVSRVVVYNETGGTIDELTISACHQSRTFHEVEERESVRLKLAATGGETDIAIATNGVVMWRGDSIEPRGGCRAIVRLRRDGQVECTATTSRWQGWLHRLASSSP